VSSREAYRKFAQFYDTYVGDFEEDLPLYRSLCDGRRRVLEIGCGTGRVLAALLGAGHDVVGVDISPDMLSIAEQKLASYLDNGRLRLLNHDFRLSPIEEQFDCVLVTFYIFNYLLEDEEQATFLRNVSTALVGNALIVLDLFYPRPRSRPETEGRWQRSTYRVGGRAITLRQKRKIAGDVEERLQVYIEDGKSEEILTHRRYNSKERMLSLLAEAGFTNVRFTNGYSVSGFHELRRGEETTSSFVAAAERPWLR